ncbi:uncharacterized protein YdaU (DUF1376 family) [Ensifer sp. KUDG1]|uniref:YdaU family protein n=1 Tax=Ensifer sp. KUDG1 TaxID=3373919 RepID=UPI003D21626C
MSELPWVRFFPSDWLGGTRGMSAVETGIYITLVATMYERREPIPEDHARLARLCGASNSAFKRALDTLVDEGKITRVEGGLWNDRVEKEQVYLSEKSEVARRAGKMSAEKRKQNQQPISTDVQRPFNGRSTKPEARSQKPEATLSSVAPAQPDFDVIQSRLIDAAGHSGIHPHGAFIVGPIVELIASGVDLETDILPVIRSAVARRTRPVGSWSYFVPAIREAYERRIAAGKGLVQAPQLATADEDWARRLRFARTKRMWSVAELGPAPGQPGCRVPAHLLEPTDGQGWTDMSEGGRAAHAA